MRRSLGVLLSLGLLAGLPGCASWFKTPSTVEPPPVPLAQLPQPADLVRYLNNEAAKVQSIEARNLDIQTRVKGRWVPALDGWMVCEKPKNFRLAAKKFGPQVDLGSNDREFWFWVKEGPQDASGRTYLFYCSYEDFEKGVQMPFPFQPEWVLQALGMAEYDPNGNYTVEQKGGTLELIEETTSQGQPIRKVTVFNARTISPPGYQGMPQVVGHIVRNAQGQVISKATISRVGTTVNPASGEPIVYPREVQLEWPAEQLTMRLSLDDVILNGSIDRNRAAGLFTRPQWRDIPAYDLARRLPEATPSSRVRPAGGYSYRGR
ncbi:MAG TPA: hypothetical protein VIL46_14860 [Gemmataceae bacterium]